MVYSKTMLQIYAVYTMNANEKRMVHNLILLRLVIEVYHVCEVLAI